MPNGQRPKRANEDQVQDQEMIVLHVCYWVGFCLCPVQGF
jgi:hypothetical protein